eukprot:TRINITY_DN1575_c1_g1_i1.p1 TRINITY_DN1575_c1_g1~~TRINITY_DN1575_c1_g1_i1.p1  ORF type:complete len:289 (+),score=100.46 TRINITY_DN1575_c1_g1_i1:79-867(+)
MARAAALLAAAWSASALKVGTVQIETTSKSTPQATVAANVAQYTSLLADAAGQGARVVVFPEFGLIGDASIECKSDKDAGHLAPYCANVPLTGSSPCGGSTPAAALACAARNSSVALSANLCEIDAAGALWNTQVVFDSSGKLLASYRKTHPFSKCFNAPAPGEQQNVTVMIEGVRFGVFTCKDILFSTPGVTLRDMGVDKFLYCAAIPIVGADTIRTWSLVHNATMVYSDKYGGMGGVYVRGKRVSDKAPAKGNHVTIYDL